MGKETQITYMQARLVRLAMREWNLTMLAVNDIFQKYGVYHYIEKFWDLFHIEGDYAVLDDVRSYLDAKGAVIGK
jgi:hypothetical protein